jgi:hypothetical protein
MVWRFISNPREVLKNEYTKIHTKSMAERGSCAADDGSKPHPKHVDLTTKEIKNTVYI